MGKFGTDRAAVDISQQRQDLPQPHSLVSGTGQPPGKKLGIHVSVGQTKVVQLQHTGYMTLHQAQRIDSCYLVASQAVNLDQARNCRLFFTRDTLFSGPGPCATAREALRFCPEARAHRWMPRLRLHCSQGLKIHPPILGHGRRISQKLLVYPLHRIGITAKQG